MKRRTAVVGIAASFAGCLDSAASMIGSGKALATIDPGVTVLTSPVAVDGTIVVGGRRTILGMKANIGGERWSRSLPGDVLSQPTAVDDSVLVTVSPDSAGDGERVWLYRIDAASGDVRWRSQLDAARAFGTVVDDDEILVRTSDHGVVAVGLDGDIRWRFDAPRQRSWLDRGDGIGLSVDDTYIYVTSDKAVLAYDRVTHATQWTVEAEEPIAPPVSTGGRVYVPAGVDGLLAVDRTTGERSWTVGSGARGRPLPVDGGVVAPIDGRLVRLDHDGSTRWKTDSLRGLICPNPVRAGSTTYCTSAAVPLAAVDDRDGSTRELVSSSQVEGGPFGPVLTEGSVYVSTDGAVFRYRR